MPICSPTFYNIIPYIKRFVNRKTEKALTKATKSDIIKVDIKEVQRGVGTMEELVRAITEAVTNVGFPIVVSGALFWYINKTNVKLTEAVNNNTKLMQKILDRLEIKEAQEDVERN